MPDNALAPHVYLTLDDNDENQVLELVKVDGVYMYIRDNGIWQPIDPEAENNRVWDRQIIDVDENKATRLFDQLEQVGQIVRDAFRDAELEEEQL